jgi:branched-chain amino acid transport system substrate-binding protein
LSRATTGHKPTDTDFSDAIAKLREANCGLIKMGTIMRDSALIIATAKKVGWNVDLLGQVASYDTAITAAPGNVAGGFEALQDAGRDLIVDSLVKAMESIQDFHDLFGGTYSFSPTNHHGATAAFLSVVHSGRWEPVVDHALVY